MIQSKIIATIQSIKHELEISRHQRIDPRRKQYLTSRLLQLEKEAGAFSFSEEEMKTGEINVSSDKQVVSKTYYVPLPSWTTSTDTDKK
jgi:hypothetical protein